MTCSTDRDYEQVLDIMVDEMGGAFGEVEWRGGFNQPARFVHDSGASVHFGSERPDQPIVVNATGEVCEKAGVVDSLVRASSKLDAWLTRLDPALDLEPTNLARRRLMQMHRAWMRGTVVTRMAPGSHRTHRDEAEGQGVTMEFGAQGGGLLLRAYDRRGPLRLEWELRPGNRDLGRQTRRQLEEVGAPGLWRRCARAAIFPMDWYKQLLVGDVADWHAPAEPAPGFAAAIDQVRESLGVQLFALKVAGIKLDDLVVEPERPRGEVLRKFKAWAPEATAMGYDGAALEEMVRCKSKSRRVRL